MVNLITPEIRQYIIENSSQPARQIRWDIKNAFGVDVSEEAVGNHMRKARANAEEATKLTDVHINKRVSEHVDSHVDEIMDRYKTELTRIGDILDGSCPDFRVKPEYNQDGSPTGFRSSYEYIQYAKTYTMMAKDYMALRPALQTIEIKTSDPEVEFLELLDDNEMQLLEKIQEKVDKLKTDHPKELA